MDRQEKLPLGVVLERREIDHPWQDHAWKPVAVVPGAGISDPRGDWTVLRQGKGWVHYLAGTLPLELFRKETEAYKVNLSQEPPRIFVILAGGADEDSAHEVVPHRVTASPYEAQDSLDSDDLVEAVPMPPDVIAFIQEFIEQHHVDQPFYKRKRNRNEKDPDGGAFRPTGPRLRDHG